MIEKTNNQLSKNENNKLIDINNLNEDEKKQLIIDYYNEIKRLKSELENKNNPISVLSDNTENLITLIDGTANKWLEFKRENRRTNIWMAIFASLMIILIIGSAGYLTFLNKIDGSTFTFLLGLVSGSTLAFLQKLIKNE